MERHRLTHEEADPGVAAAILAAASGAARYAPSIHNTQPWRWRAAGPVIELGAAPDRQLSAGDPSGRMLTVSCGASLAYAVAAVAAQGWRPIVARPMTSEVLATVAVGEAVADHAEASALFRTFMERRTDRRPLREPAPTTGQIDAIQAAAERRGAHILPLCSDQVVRLGMLADAARQWEGADVARCREIEEWVAVGDDASGVPRSTIPTPGGHYAVPPRFGGGQLPTEDSGGDAAAAYLVLVTDRDDRPAWLRGGEALVHAWAAAITAGLAVMPLSSVVEVAQTRLALYRMLLDVGHPLLILRVGHPEPSAVPPSTSRLSARP